MPEITPEFSSDKVKFLGNLWESISYNTMLALSQTLGKNVSLSDSKALLDDMENVPHLLNPNNSSVAVVIVPIKGAKGVIFFSSDQNSMLKLGDLLLHIPLGSSKGFNSNNMSSIKELGNILAGYYAEGFLKLMDMASFKIEQPSLIVNEYRAIENSGLGNVYKNKYKVLLFNLEFSVTEITVKARMLLVFRQDLAERIYESIIKKV